MNNLRVVLIHGNGGGKSTDFWLPSIKKGLENLGMEVVARNFPDAQLAREKFWLPFLKTN